MVHVWAPRTPRGRLRWRRACADAAEVSSPELVAELRRRGTVLELCATSDLRTGVVDDLSRHPVRKLAAVGVPVVIGVDDPLLFGSTVLGEYRTALTCLGFSREDLLAAARTSLSSSLLAQQTRDRLLAARDDYVLRRG